MSFLKPMLIGAVVGGLIGAGPAFLVAWLMLRRRRRIYRSLRAQLPPQVTPEQVCDVRYASARRLKSMLKILPWELTGILFADEQGLSAWLQSGNSKRNLTLRFDPERDVVEWRGQESFMRNGPLNWLAIGTPKAPEHFFTSETGLTILGSKDKTQDIVRMLQSSLHITRCLQCEYELWGNTTGVCPECGTAFARPSAELAGQDDADDEMR